MAAPWYERLAAADRSFLVFEGRHTHMHVGGTTIFDGGSLLGAGGAIDVDRIRARRTVLRTHGELKLRANLEL